MVGLAVIGCFLVYGTIASMIYYVRCSKTCDKCIGYSRKTAISDCSCYYCEDAKAASVCIGIFWPIVYFIAIPIVLGKRLASLNPTWFSPEARKQRGIERARHMEELANIRLREAKALEEALEIQQRNNPLTIQTSLYNY